MAQGSILQEVLSRAHVECVLVCEVLSYISSADPTGEVAEHAHKAELEMRLACNAMDERAGKGRSGNE